MPFAKGQSGNSRGRPEAPVAQYRRQIKAAKQLMADALVETTTAVCDAATGLWTLLIPGPLGVGWVRATTPEQIDAALAGGERFYRIYQQDPDLAACGVVMDRIMGKVPQPIDVEVRQVLEHATADQDTLACILQEHVPAEYLAPVLDELRRVRAHRRRAVAVLAATADPS